LELSVFVVLAAAVGFAVGWLVRGSGAEGAHQRREDERRGTSALEAERDHLRSELDAAQRAKAELQAALDEANARLQGAEQAQADEPGKEDLEPAKQRIAELGGEIEAAQQAEREARADLSELQDPGLAPAPADDGKAGKPPRRLDAPEGEPDDLKRINGIGPGIEKTLHGLGIFHFRQIAELSPDNIVWIDQHLAFPGRIEREDWIGQAKTLMQEGESR